MHISYWQFVYLRFQSLDFKRTQHNIFFKTSGYHLLAATYMRRQAEQTSLSLSIYIYTLILSLLSISISLSLYIYIYIYMYMYMCVYIYIYIYIYTHRVAGTCRWTCSWPDRVPRSLSLADLACWYLILWNSRLCFLKFESVDSFEETCTSFQHIELTPISYPPFLSTAYRWS